MRFDWSTQAVVAQATVEENRHLNGHGSFSPDGKLFYTSENDTTGNVGVIGVRASGSLEKLAELPSHGIGPHDLFADEHGSLMVANGGILHIPRADNNDDANVLRTRPDPSLVRLDASSGRLLGRWRLPDPWLSIRHLAPSGRSAVGVALQAAHPMDVQRVSAPVLALFDGQHLATARDAQQQSLQGYGGDVAAIATQDGLRFAVGCSRANAIAWWDEHGQWLGSYALREACAVAAYECATLAATEAGEVRMVGHDGAVPSEFAQQIPIAWDNHVVVLQDHS